MIVFCLLMKKMYCNIDFTENEVVLVLDKAQLAFQDEGTLLEIDAPVSICGDIHGHTIGWPPLLQSATLNRNIRRIL
ncbi:hypothetical protein T10_10398 [Trichinella papuae]|uniref:Uncharacterized protein n=1 Tax=Trichinella papuae TaxID=268474 RepID=A0A0V1N325_9BILA|nr:hypothetical protein T10_10398 [Trichinella papuae]